MENLKNIMSEADYTLWVKLEERGKRIGEIINDPKCNGNYKYDAVRGAKKIFHQKQRLLKKYGLK